MQCSRCGAANPSGKFCHNCGAQLTEPVAAAYQPSPYPVPPPPAQPHRSTSWLLWAGIPAGVLLLALGGFLLWSQLGDTPATPGGPTVVEPGKRQPASAAALATEYMEARKAGDLARAYSLLSKNAREAYNQQVFAAYVGQFRVIAYGTVEEPEPMGDGWSRVLVRNVAFDDGQVQDVSLTLHQEADTLTVALDSPLHPQALALEEQGKFQEMLVMGGLLRSINPYSDFAHQVQGWAHYYAGDNTAAIASYTEALKYALPQHQPEILSDMGLPYQEAGQYDEALKVLERALREAAEYPDLYDQAWAVNVLIGLADNTYAKGDWANGFALAERLLADYADEQSVRDYATNLQRWPLAEDGDSVTYRLFADARATFKLPSGWETAKEANNSWFARLNGDTGPGVRATVYPADLGSHAEELTAALLGEHQAVIVVGKGVNADLKVTDSLVRALSDGETNGLFIEFSDGSMSMVVESQGPVGPVWLEFHWAKYQENQEAIALFLQNLTLD